MLATEVGDLLLYKSGYQKREYKKTQKHATNTQANAARAHQYQNAAPLLQ